MKLFAAIFGVVFLIYVAIFMSMILRWNDETGVEKEKWSKAWHGWSTLLRLGAVVLWVPFFWQDYLIAILLMSVFLNLSWTLYDGICNWFRKLSFWYIGSTSSGTGSWWDKMWTVKSSRIAKIILMVLTVTYIVLYFIVLF